MNISSDYKEYNKGNIDIFELVSIYMEHILQENITFLVEIRLENRLYAKDFIDYKQYLKWIVWCDKQADDTGIIEWKGTFRLHSTIKIFYSFSYSISTKALQNSKFSF